MPVFEHDCFIKILEHKKESAIEIICKKLKIEIYYEDSVYILCGVSFVIDVDLLSKKTNITFEKEMETRYFSYLRNYFDLCLINNNMKLFYCFLKFLVYVDTASKENQKHERKCNLIKDDQSNMMYCDCILTDGFYCIFDSLSSLNQSKADNYNILTHRNEFMITKDNFMFNFAIIQDEVQFFSQIISVNEFISLRKRVLENPFFYRLMNEDFHIVNDTTIKIKLQNYNYEIKDDLSVLLHTNGNTYKSSKIEYLLRRGVQFKDAQNFVHPNYY